MRASSFSRHVPKWVYWPGQHELIDRILGVASTIVACDPEDEAHVYGCCVFQPGDAAILHWLYVKGDFRRLGLGSELLTAAVGDKRPVYCSQASPLFQSHACVERFELVYSPYLLLGIAPPPYVRPRGGPEASLTPKT